MKYRPARLALASPCSATIVFALSLLTIAVGTYMSSLRPPLLPEDVRALGVDPNILPPSLMRWLSLVFATWGVFIAAFGIVLLGVASTLRTGGTRALRRPSALV